MKIFCLVLFIGQDAFLQENLADLRKASIFIPRNLDQSFLQVNRDSYANSVFFPHMAYGSFAFYGNPSTFANARLDINIPFGYHC